MDEYSSPRESWVTVRKDVRHSAAYEVNTCDTCSVHLQYCIVCG